MNWQRLCEDLALHANGSVALRNARVFAPALPPELRAMVPVRGEELVDLAVADGRVAAIEPAGTFAEGIDLQGRWVLPPFADTHVHLDKTFTISRLGVGEAAPPSLLAAVRATQADRLHWTPEDIERRASHAIRLALAHGTTRLRTHVDVRPGQGGWSGWDTLLRLRRQWQGHVHIDMVAMLPMETYAGFECASLADRVARDGGLLGGVTKAMGRAAADEQALVDAALDALLPAARERGLAVDLHVDESCDPAAQSFDAVARAATKHGMEGRIACSHCCSLSYRSKGSMDAALRAARAAGLHIVALPTANEYLQDRQPGRTPRLRGGPPVTEMRAAGLPVAIASDNCGDAFYPFGQYDPLDILRSAVRMLHLAPPCAGWLPAVTSTASSLPSTLSSACKAAGSEADFNIFDAMDVHALLSCPQARRLMLRHGRAVRHDWPEALPVGA